MYVYHAQYMNFTVLFFLQSWCASVLNTTRDMATAHSIKKRNIIDHKFVIRVLYTHRNNWHKIIYALFSLSLSVIFSEFRNITDYHELMCL